MNSKNGKNMYVQENLNKAIKETIAKDLCIQRVRNTLCAFVWGADELVRKAICIDAELLATNPITFITENLFQYMVAICLWILLTQDVFADRVLEADLRDSLGSRGLAWTVDVVKSAFSAVLHGTYTEELKTTPWLLYPCGELLSHPSVKVTSWFRFLARFSPIKASKRDRETEKAFFDWNDQIEHDPFKRKGQYLTSVIAMGPISKISDFHFDYNKFAWSNGACNDGNTVLEKLRSFAKFSPNLGSPLYPLQGGVQAQVRYNVVTPLAVPKSLKGPRIIAPVSSYTGALSHQLRKHLTSELKRLTGIDLATQQDKNRAAAQRASVITAPGLEVATIDESRASDSIPWGAYLRVFPRTITVAMTEVREDVFINKYRFSHVRMAFASGNPSTFVSETWFFYSCGETSCWYAAYFSDVEDKQGLYLEYLEILAVYGDDVIIPTAAADTFMDIIESFGIHANRDKSYQTGPFRESCGGEYVNGTPVQSYYWPRKEVKSESPVKAAFMLSEMHNKFFNASDYRTLCRVLKTLVLKLYPKMTFQHGFEYSDLHDVMGTITQRTAPVGIFYDVQLHVVKEKTVKEAMPGMNPQWLSTPTRYVTYRHTTVYPKSRRLDTSDFALPCDKETKTPLECTQRDVHAVLSTVYKEYTYDMDIEMLLYVDFLENGPYYETPLDELLGVSTPRLARKTLTGTGREEVKRVFV